MKRFALAFVAGAMALAPSHFSHASVTAKISIAQQRMEVHVDDKLVHTWPVSTGREGYETPTGTYTPYMLSKDHRSSLYNDAPMPFAVFFRGNYAVHGTTSLSMLGRRASHGCVRLSPANARRFFELVQQHGLSASKVIVHEPTPKRDRSFVAEIGSKRARSARTPATQVATSPAAFGATVAYPRVGYPVRYLPTPTFVYQIGPHGQIIPVQYPAYSGYRLR